MRRYVAIVCLRGSWRAIDVVTIPVRDQDAAWKFYAEKLRSEVAGDGKQRWIELLIPAA